MVKPNEDAIDQLMSKINKELMYISIAQFLHSLHRSYPTLTLAISRESISTLWPMLYQRSVDNIMREYVIPFGFEQSCFLTFVRSPNLVKYLSSSTFCPAFLSHARRWALKPQICHDLLQISQNNLSGSLETVVVRGIRNVEDK